MEISKPSKGTQVPTSVAVLVIGIVLLVFVYAFKPANATNRCTVRRAIESTVRADLHIMRTGLENFQADTGVYPATLQDLYAPNEKALQTKVKPGTYKGPYFDENVSTSIPGTRLPMNRLLHKPHDPTIAHHWTYDPKTGKVHSAVKGTTVEGKSYADL